MFEKLSCGIIAGLFATASVVAEAFEAKNLAAVYGRKAGFWASPEAAFWIRTSRRGSYSPSLKLVIARGGGKYEAELFRLILASRRGPGGVARWVASGGFEKLKSAMKEELEQLE